MSMDDVRQRQGKGWFWNGQMADKEEEAAQKTRRQFVDDTINVDQKRKNVTLSSVTEAQGERKLQERKRGEKDSRKKSSPTVQKKRFGFLRLNSVQESNQREQRLSRKQTTACAALCAVGGYISLRGGISIYHRMRRKLLRQMLVDLYYALNDSSAKDAVWLDFGCLLGVYRDGDLIIHDNDVDIAVLNPDWPRLVTDLKKRLPQYRICLESPSDCPSTQFVRVYFRGFWGGFADIFPASLLDQNRLLVDCGHGDTTAIEMSSCLPTGKYVWQGIPLDVPRSIESVLEQRYGLDWRTPRYMDKGTDIHENAKTYAKIFRALSKFGIRL